MHQLGFPSVVSSMENTPTIQPPAAMENIIGTGTAGGGVAC